MRIHGLWFKIAVAGLILAIIPVIYIFFHFFSFVSSSGTSGPAREVFYEVQRKSTPRIVAMELHEQGVVANPRFFFWYGRFTGRNGRFKAGDYRFTTAMRPDEVLGILTSGISYATPVTIPEGFTMKQISELYEKQKPGFGKKFLKLCTNESFISSLGFKNEPSSLEGYLFPDTYLIGRRTEPEEIVQQMVRKYRQIYTPEISEKARQFGFTEHEVVTLASIIEKETGAPQERPLVSSVFHNRLKKKMKLQTDPTVIYGIRNYQGNITKKDLLTPTPYNTYVIPGLPPGPIANPGKESIRAAVEPAPSKYLFFASKNDGTHYFSETAAQHNEAVKQYLLNKKARESHSWRELTHKLGKDQKAKADSVQPVQSR